jgi:hypothetical protein
MVCDSLSLCLTYSILLTGLTEFYYTTYISKNITLSSQSNYLLKNRKSAFNNSSNILIYYLAVQLIALISLKLSTTTVYFNITSNTYYIIYVIIFIMGIIHFLSSYSTSNITYILLCWMIVILQLFYTINDFLIFILAVEVIATIYYFFFLNNITNTPNQLLKLKNLIANYLWLSFFTLIVFACSLIFIIISTGTLNFNELNLLVKYADKFSVTLLLCSIFIKLGLPGFHFFKLDLYRFLQTSTIFYFSIFSLVLNVYLLWFLLIKLSMFFLYINSLLIFIVLISNIILLSRGLNNLKLFQFIGLSSLNTLTTILLFTII